MSVSEQILTLHGGDPFEYILRAAEEHRPGHGPECGLYPAGPHVMRLAAALARAAGAKRLLDIGAGFGYSTLWLAEAAGPEGHVDAIDRFPEHADTARRFARVAGLDGRVTFHAGEAVELLEKLEGPYDLVHDDGWFAEQPPYFERMVALLRPGGMLTMPNWFLLEEALSGSPRRDWSEFAGPDWGSASLSYAQKLAADPRLFVTWSLSPPLGIAIKDPACS